MDSIVSAICYITCGFISAWLILASRFSIRYSIVEIFYKVDDKNRIDWDYRFNVVYDKESRDHKLNEIFADESEEARSKIILQFDSTNKKHSISINNNFFELSKKEGLKL